MTPSYDKMVEAALQVERDVREKATDILERLQRGERIVFGKKGIRHPGGAGGLLLVMHLAKKCNSECRTIELRPDILPGDIVLANRLLKRAQLQNSAAPNSAD